MKVEGGIKADVTFLNFKKADAPGAVSTLTPGATIGGLMDIWFKEWIGIQKDRLRTSSHGPSVYKNRMSFDIRPFFAVRGGFENEIQCATESIE